jgi:hypothetical protein
MEVTNIKSGILCLAFIGIGLSSCKKDSASPSSPVNTLSTQIQKRWAVSGASFSSMEFNNSNQAIVVFGSSQQTPDSVKSYYYKASDDKTIEIKNFGKMSVSSINEDSIRFSFLPVSGASVSLSGKKSGTSVVTTSNNSLLCRTWKMDRWVEDGETIVNFDTLGLITATFTQNGTYFISGGINFGDSTYVDSEPNLSWWKWSGSNPGQQLCYSHESEIFDCDSSNTVLIETLTSTELNIKQYGINYILKPYNLPGRISLASKPASIRIRLRKGSFLRK